MKKIISSLLFSILIISCKQKEKADLLIFNANIYTVDSAFNTAEAMVINEGKFLAVGKKDSLEKLYDVKEKMDAGGKSIFPGFIDAHAHFKGYAEYLTRVNLIGTKSWQEIIDTLKSFALANPDGWLTGRGWDQNDWPVKEFPTNEELNKNFPDRPVLIRRIDGHAAVANEKALELAGIKPGYTVTGGLAEMRNGKLTGILVDNAVDLVLEKIPALNAEQFKNAFKKAEKNCFAVGLTTIDDCGLDFETVEMIRRFQDSGNIKMRLYVMLSDNPANYNYLEKKGIIKTDKLNVRSFKVYGDGALGSRGACLLQPYLDRPGQYGFLLSNPGHFDSVAQWIAERDFQMCTHAIGDSANRTMLKIYAKHLAGKNDRRWRIEHAQVINTADFNLFGANNIVPSVQPTHATSDMYWVPERIGKEREKGAYAYQQLLNQNGWIPLGTDFPVEDISPLKTFFAAVFRKDATGYPQGGYNIENALTREQAIRGMTIWAAKSNFEEKEKGSIEKGKWADFILLDKDLMKVPEAEILGTKVLGTWVGGVKVFASTSSATGN